ncbi:MAG: cyclase dehydrase [Bradyrhizobium sp.]
MRSSVQATAIRGRSHSPHDRMAKNLGYLSLALGAAELIAPRALCRATGLSGMEPLMRAFGAREIATGVAILASHNPAPWIWGRVAGDMADIAAAASGIRSDGGQNRNAVLTLAALTAVTAVDVMCASGLDAEKGNRKTAMADYSDRSGFPQGLEAARGAARHLTIPQDMKTPKSLRLRR